MRSINNTQKALVHIARQQLGLTDEEYIGILQDHAGVTSSKFMDNIGLQNVMAEFKARGFVQTGKAAKHTPDYEGSKKRLLWKISNQLNQLSLPMSYAEGMARRMFKIQKDVGFRVEFCTPAQLHKMVSALNYHIRKEQRVAR